MFLENFHCHLALSSSKLNVSFENQALYLLSYTLCFPYQLCRPNTVYVNSNTPIYQAQLWVVLWREKDGIY